jgi:glucose-1-phosphate cytidylyltransferase
MKTVILCGGKGSRLVEETFAKPKPMINIGEKPILCHIMEIFQYYGFNDFILAAGYKKEIIEKYFSNTNGFQNVSVVDTGSETMTGGRILRLKKILKDEERFFMTYGDAVSDINISKLLEFHKAHQKIATVTAVHPPVRFGELEVKNKTVINFAEKPQVKSSWISGGFFVLENKVLDYIKNDETVFEREPMESITKEGQLMAYEHEKYWQCMDTLRDKILLNKLYAEKKAPWKK